MIQLHNTRTGKTEPFESILPEQVTLYTCGPTVYSEPLIGNWVAYLRWDLLVRVLKANNYQVNRVMNITDVGHLVSDADDGEDKIQKGARREGVTAWEIADRYTNRFLEGMTTLNLLPPEILSKATEHIAEQIELVKTLEAKGHTYVIDDGVYFDTSTFPSYTDFAHLNLETMRPGERVEENTQKKNPSDFALWKFSPKNEKRDMEWDSPWSPPSDPEGNRKGFPGWHIECSAMALKYLGETIDIHTGGIDHIPVHHTNEIAQSEAATGKRFANYWLHANFLMVEGSKISKSLGNGYTLDDLVQKGYSALDFRMFVLQSQYRTETNFTWENLAGAKSRLAHWKAIACLRHQTVTIDADSLEMSSAIRDARKSVLEVLNDDLNSPLAMTGVEAIFDQVETIGLSNNTQQDFNELLIVIDDLLGLSLLSSTPDITEQQMQLIKERETSRDAKDWTRSDEIRGQLTSSGIGVNDTPSGTRWFYL